MPGRDPQSNKSIDMARQVLCGAPQRVPLSFACNHPGYGAGALAAADENLAAELAARRAAHHTAVAAGPAQPQHQSPPSAVAAFDAKLAAARKETAAAKAAYQKALAVEKELERQREQALAREKKVKKMDGEKAAKMRKREKALGIKPAKTVVAAKPVGVQKAVAVEKKKAVVTKSKPLGGGYVGVLKRAALEEKLERLGKREVLTAEWLEEG